jgi:hypothetical protein
MTEIENLVQTYYDWLKRDTVIREGTGEWTEISLPYLDRHNDYLGIYVKKDGDNYILSDDSVTIDDLTLVGYSLDNEDDRAMIDSLLLNYGASLSADHNELTIQTNVEKFAENMYNLVQTMLTLSVLPRKPNQNANYDSV